MICLKLRNLTKDILVLFTISLYMNDIFCLEFDNKLSNTQIQDNYVTFWSKEAQKLDWFQKWTITEEKGFPFVRWFKNGKLNVCYNCVDRHIKAGLGNKVAFYWENERGAKKIWTYNDIFIETKKLANVYKSLGLKKGDRISIYMPMVPESIVAMLAATRIGVVHNFIFGGIGGASVKERINDSASSVLITADGGFRRGKTINYKKTVDSILNECPTIKHTIVLKYNQDDIQMKEGRDIWYHEAMAKVDSECPCESMDSEDMMFLLYTSGTTGKPKGLIHSTAGYLVGVNSTYSLVFDIKPTDVYWCTADPGWITGHSFAVYGPMCNAVTQFMYEGALDYPSKDQFSKFVEKYKITTFYTAPTFVSMLMKWGEKESIGSHDLSTLRLLGSIGEPLKPEVWEWYNKYVGRNKCPIMDTWFQTETGAFVISPIPGKTKLKPGSVTKGLPGYTVDILNENGDSVKRGLLAIKKPFPSMMRGVYRDNERYLKTYWSKWNGKYYYAGDNANRDDDGYIYVSGRSDEVLKVSGHRIGTAEIEAAIMDDQRVAETAVIGIEDKIKGTSVLAFVVIKSQHLQKYDQDTFSLSKELRLHVQKSLGSYAKPEHIIFVSQVPKNRSGKVLRRILRCIFEGKEYGNIETLVNPSSIAEIEKKVRQYKEKQDFLFSRFFSPITSNVRINKNEIIREIQLMLEDHLVNYSYDRIYSIVEFLKFFDENKELDSNITPLEALNKFDTNTVFKSTNKNAGSCFILAKNFCENLPINLEPNLIMAKMSKRFQQTGFHRYSHVACVIHYEDRENKSDKGIILMDPNFDIPVPLVFNSKNKEVTVYMGKKRGNWNFKYDGNVVVCEFDNERDGQKDKMVYYVNRAVTNPHLFALKPMIASDTIPSIVIRDKNGTHVAHLKLNLIKRTITCSVNGKYLPKQTFEEFMQEPRLSVLFCNKLNFSSHELIEAMKKIITHIKVLDVLRNSWYKKTREEI